jgi:hypothetical protein
MKKHAHQFISDLQQRTTIIPIPNNHQLSIVNAAGGYEIAILNSQGLVIDPFFGGSEVERVETWAEVEEIVGYLLKRGFGMP